MCYHYKYKTEDQTESGKVLQVLGGSVLERLMTHKSLVYNCVLIYRKNIAKTDKNVLEVIVRY